MAIIAIVMGIIGAIGVWWWRAQQIKGAADSIVDAAGKARGMVSRARFKHQTGQSVLAGVDSPGMAAVTLLYSLASLRRPVALADEQKIEGLLETVCRMTKQERDDAMAFAAWAPGQVADTSDIVRRFLPMWRETLEQGPRRELLGMAVTIANEGGPPTDAQALAIRRLSEGLLN